MYYTQKQSFFPLLFLLFMHQHVAHYCTTESDQFIVEELSVMIKRGHIIVIVVERKKKKLTAVVH